MSTLRIRDLVKSFGGFSVINGISCEFPAGKISSVIGPNGAGKTTFFNLVTGFIMPDSGKVFLGETDITKMPPHKIVALGMTRTFQLVRVFPRLSLLDNVLLGYLDLPGNSLMSAIFYTKRDKAKYSAKKAEARAMLDYVGLSKYENAMANDLSYGQQKLVEIARALVSKPKVLLIDEPLAGLNVVMIDKMLTLLDDIKKNGKTVILIEHNIDVVKQISDQITVMNFGKVIASDIPAKVINDPLVIDAYLGVIQNE
ncbi:MAG: ABC transporter ATP-binding protein [Anaerolineaceae bacterium]|jgi:ABC-type branched-subunit amino acid transport system ATPase component